MSTIAAGYLEPGTYPKVLNQVIPPANAPAFITALIGTSSTDKPTSKVLTRGDTSREDSLDTTVTIATAISDEYGVEYVEGQDWARIVDTGTTYIEWAARYISNNPITGVTFQPFTTTVGITPTPITTDDGTYNLVWNGSTTLTWAGGTPVTITTDGAYELTDAATGSIVVSVVVANLPAASGVDSVILSTLGPDIGVDYTVEYRKAKTSADLIAQNFDALDALQAFHGTVLNDSINYPEVSNAEALSVGAVPYFDAGGGSVIAVPIRDKKIDSASGWDIYNANTGIADAAWAEGVREALTKLEAQPQVSCIIVLTPAEGGAVGYRKDVINNVKSHLSLMNSTTEAKPRMAIFGARANTISESVFTDSAGTCRSENIVYLAPATASKVIGGFNKLLNGSTIASALAGILSDPQYNAGEPISGKQISVFTNLPDPFSGRLQKNRIASAGVTLIEIQNSTPTVRHFLTTDQTSILTGEAKVTKIKIDVRRTLKTTFDATMINKRLVDGQSISLLQSLLGLVLNQKVTDQVINAFRIKSIQVDPIDARQLNVKVEIKPTFDLNYILIEATFVTQ